MSGNSFGKFFKITTFGESHGGYVGVVIDGCPAGLTLTKKDIQKELNRRKPGQSKITTTRKEEDKISILSGIFKNKTTGAPITLVAKNKDPRPKNYYHLKNIYRPSHADYVYEKKYGIRDWRGGGRASARETLARVAAGAVAKKFLLEKVGIEIISFVEQVGSIKASVDLNKVTIKMVEANIVRCPDKDKAKKMILMIKKLHDAGDSIGGVVCGIIKNTPIGLGEPVFDKLDADLAKAMLSIPATKGFEIGSGFQAANILGSKHNDEFILNKGKIRTRTNFSGGIQAGISNGENIYFKIVFKPTSTIKKEQKTVSQSKHQVKLKASGRHDPCVLPRAVPIVDAMAALVLMDHFLRHGVQKLTRKNTRSK
ncbi:chorismate synthase [Patescibacteria group bacterium]